MGSDDSATWPAATPEEFEPVPRICRLILANYELDLRQHHLSPAGAWNPDWIIKRADYEDTLGHAPPYLIYANHHHREIVLAMRGLNLAKESDYEVLLNNRLGQQMFDGGYVHHGLLKSAMWVLNRESETLKRAWIENGSCYKMIFAGHSLGSGVAALMTVVVVNHRDQLGGIPRNLIRCYAIAPARCMSLNMAVKYADVIHSVILQDDFLPRTATPLEDIFKSVFCLPCLMFLVCLRDTFIAEERKLRDPRRLYAPGRMYHIVERKFCRCGRFPPEVRTAIPVDGRFEHIVLSCNATADHGIIWIEREAEKALQIMKESTAETLTSPPRVQSIERLQTIEKEHKDALERAVSLNVPHAVPVEDDPSEHADLGPSREPSSEEKNVDSWRHKPTQESSETKSEPRDGRTNWNELVEKLFKKNESGSLVLKTK